MKNSYIHRFGDKVAISLPGKCETVYIPAAAARKIAAALNACARDVTTQPNFCKSTFTGRDIELPANTGPHS